MRKEEIIVGATYSNGRAVRRVVAAGPEYRLYSSQAETDCLAYAIVRGRKEALDRGRTAGGEQIRHSTRASFATWAKERVPSPSPLAAEGKTEGEP